MASDLSHDPARRAWLRDAVTLLGGSRAAARALGINEVSMSRLLGDGPNARGIRDGILKDMRQLLRAHADACIAQADALLSLEDD
ncbi:MAG: hypothetical protein ACOY5R_06750 [Pseudomonadota bacterium]